MSELSVRGVAVTEEELQRGERAAEKRREAMERTKENAHQASEKAKANAQEATDRARATMHEATSPERVESSARASGEAIGSGLRKVADVLIGFKNGFQTGMHGRRQNPVEQHSIARPSQQPVKEAQEVTQVSAADVDTVEMDATRTKD